MNIYDERINGLRALMKDEGIDYYVIPTADDHASEYISPYYKVRKYYAGFSGSAGTLVIGRDMAGLWTDGRYFIQAEKELEGSCVALFKMGSAGVPSVSEYLRNVLQEGGVIGFDGEVIDEKQGELYEEIAKNKKGMIRWEKDLAGSLWEKRPERSSAAVFELDLCYAGKTRADKLKDVRALMENHQAEGVLISALDDIAWLMNLRGDDVARTPVFLSFALVLEDQVNLYVFEEAFSKEIRSRLEADGIVLKPYGDVYEDVRTLRLHKLLTDPGQANYALMHSVAAETVVEAALGYVLIPKAVKNPVELENLRQIHILDGIAVTKFMYWLKTRVGKEEITELSAQAYLLHLREEIEGYIDLSFDTICAYKEHAAMMHYASSEATDVILKPEGMLLVDSGGQYLKGTTDITRTFVLGPITDEQKKHYTLTAKSMLNLANTKFLYGCSGYSLDIVARSPLWQIGIDYRCGTGHGVGYLLNVHEGPNAFRWRWMPERGYTVLEEGMVTSDEPGVYIEGSHGIRIENMMVCKKDIENEYGQFMRHEMLTMVPIDLDGIDTAWLNPEDIRQLDAYHAQVFETISPYLNEEERAWLKVYTCSMDSKH